MLLRWSGVLWFLCVVVSANEHKQKADSCDKLSCQHRCTVENGEAACTCDEGFTLTRDGQHCKDVDECRSFPPPCSQMCNNTSGGYVCSCDAEHYTLINNGTCKAKGERPKLIYASDKEIVIKILNSTLSPTRIKVPYFFAHHLSYVPFGHYVYWVDKNGNQEVVFRRGIYNTFGTPEKVVSVSGTLNAIKMDWINEVLYMAQGKQLKVCGSSPFICKTLWDSSELIVDVAVNPKDREIFWIEHGKHIMKCSSACGLDDSSPQFIASDNMGNAGGLVIDRTTRTAYWGDRDKKVIESSSIDGHNKERRVVLNLQSQPTSLAIFEDTVYWSDGRGIQAADKFTGKRQESPIPAQSGHDSLWSDHSTHFYPHEIIIAHPSIQTQEVRPCVFAQCSQLCLPSPAKKYVCACDDQSEMMTDGVTCRMMRTTPHLLLTTGDDIYQMNTNTLNSPTKLISAWGIGEFDQLAHDPVSDVIVVYVSGIKSIHGIKPENRSNWQIFNGSIVGGLAIDEENGNVYWTVSSEGKVMATAINNPKQPITTGYMFGLPTAIAIASKEGLVFVADSVCGCIFSMTFDGSNVTKLESEVSVGSMVVSTQHNLALIWTDITRESIHRMEVKERHSSTVKPFIEPSVELVLTGETLYWLPVNKSYIYSADNFGHGRMHYTYIDSYIADSGMVHHLALMNPRRTSSNICRTEPNGCDYFCTSTEGKMKCLCPNGMHLKEDGKTCDRSTCQYGTFRCDDKCLPDWHRCNGKEDCKDGADETNCTEGPKKCLSHEFKCRDNQCVPQSWRCDGQADCTDQSDEKDCPPCPKGNWKCKTLSSCILKKWLCDGREDCSDGSDEAPEQCKEVTCGKDQFKCDHGGCIEMSERCDGFEDCVDKSDEKNCLRKCDNLMVSCNDGTCIPRSFQCDGEKDCPDGEDELPPVCPTPKFRNCTCPPSNWFTCKEEPSICLPLVKRCNGVPDCPYGTDEKQCPTYCPNGLDSEWCLQLCDKFNFPFCQRSQEVSWKPVSCDQHSWQCPGSTKCIPLSKTCDGKPDCPQGDDEGEQCESACYKNGGCEYHCKATSFGPKCSCHAGYILAMNGKSCTDHDECNSVEGYCSQMCINKGGGLPMCKCGEGYKLESDRKTCKAMGERGKLLFAVENSIRMLNLADDNLELLTTSRKEIKGIGYDSKKYIVYWTEVSCKVTTVKRKRIYDGVVEPQVIAMEGESTSMSYDWVNENIYVSRNASLGYIITICSMSTLQCSDIISAKGFIAYVVVDPVNKRLFWIESALDRSLHYTMSLIRSSRLDGAEVVTLKETPNAKTLAIDHVLSKIYWSDANLQAILAMDYNGNRTRLVLTARHGLTHPNALTVFEDFVYFSNMDHLEDVTVSPCIDNSNITVCNKFTADRCKNIHRHHSGASSFAVTNPVLQPNVRTSCKERKCNGICVPLGDGSTCIPGKLNQINGPCNVTQVEQQQQMDDETNIKFVTPSEPETLEDDGISSGGLAAGIIVPILLLLLVGAGFYYMRNQKKSEYCRSPHRIPFKGLDSILMEEDELQNQREVEDNDSNDNNRPTTNSNRSISWKFQKGGKARLQEES